VIEALEHVIEALEHVIDQRGAPVRLSLDSGSERQSRALDAWTAATHRERRFIQSGTPIKTALVESSNGLLREGCLSGHCFLTLRDARFYMEHLRPSYNTDSSSRAFWPLTPAEHADTTAPPSGRRSAEGWSSEMGRQKGACLATLTLHRHAQQLRFDTLDLKCHTSTGAKPRAVATLIVIHIPRGNKSTIRADIEGRFVRMRGATSFISWIHEMNILA
jgi:Integrase core domain